MWHRPAYCRLVTSNDKCKYDNEVTTVRNVSNPWPSRCQLASGRSWVPLPLGGLRFFLSNHDWFNISSFNTYWFMFGSLLYGTGFVRIFPLRLLFFTSSIILLVFFIPVSLFFLSFNVLIILYW